MSLLGSIFLGFFDAAFATGKAAQSVAKSIEDEDFKNWKDQIERQGNLELEYQLEKYICLPEKHNKLWSRVEQCKKEESGRYLETCHQPWWKMVGGRREELFDWWREKEYDFLWEVYDGTEEVSPELRDKRRYMLNMLMAAYGYMSSDEIYDTIKAEERRRIKKSRSKFNY